MVNKSYFIGFIYTVHVVALF